VKVSWGEEKNEAPSNDPETTAQIYSEEMGAFLDTQLNTSDTVGDEGEMFRRLLPRHRLNFEPT
jgi:hypothetical protein